MILVNCVHVWKGFWTDHIGEHQTCDRLWGVAMAAAAGRRSATSCNAAAVKKKGVKVVHGKEIPWNLFSPKAPYQGKVIENDFHPQTLTEPTGDANWETTHVTFDHGGKAGASETAVDCHMRYHQIVDPTIPTLHINAYYILLSCQSRRVISWIAGALHRGSVHRRHCPWSRPPATNQEVLLNFHNFQFWFLSTSLVCWPNNATRTRRASSRPRSVSTPLHPQQLEMISLQTQSLCVPQLHGWRFIFHNIWLFDRVKQ